MRNIHEYNYNLPHHILKMSHNGTAMKLEFTNIKLT